MIGAGIAGALGGILDSNFVTCGIASIGHTNFGDCMQNATDLSPDQIIMYNPNAGNSQTDAKLDKAIKYGSVAIGLILVLLIIFIIAS